MIRDVGDKFTQVVAAFDEKKCFGHAAFKESAKLPRTYFLEFVNWVVSPGSTITTHAVSQKPAPLKCLYHVRSHVFCPSTLEIHASQRMPVSVLQHTHICCFLISLLDVAPIRC